jgi:hypothetical protein
VRRIAPIVTAGALACTCLTLGGCGTGVTGARREGPAPTQTVRAQSTRPPAIASDPTALAHLVRLDTSVSADVREDLTPCVGDDYPMNTDSGYLTAGDGPDLVVNITTCGDGLGVAAYVYRMIGGKYENVFADERPPVYASVDGGRLQVIHEVYRTDDPVSYPTGAEQTTYAWQGNRFVEIARSFSDFTAKDPSASPEPTSTRQLPAPSASPIDPAMPSMTSAPRALPHYQPSSTGPATPTPGNTAR